MGLVLVGMVTAGIGGIIASHQFVSHAQNNTVEVVGMMNPLHEATVSEVQEQTGVLLAAPEGAEDIACFYLDGADGETPTAQMTFTLDGKNFCFREQKKELTEQESAEMDASLEEIGSELNDQMERATIFSGMYYDFKACAGIMVNDFDGICAFNDGKEGMIYWEDIDDGVQYSLSMDKKADQDTLQKTAEQMMEVQEA